jgi:hypothetical protein
MLRTAEEAGLLLERGDALVANLRAEPLLKFRLVPLESPVAPLALGPEVVEIPPGSAV